MSTTTAPAAAATGTTGNDRDELEAVPPAAAAAAWAGESSVVCRPAVPPKTPTGIETLPPLAAVSPCDANVPASVPVYAVLSVRPLGGVVGTSESGMGVRVRVPALVVATRDISSRTRPRRRGQAWKERRCERSAAVRRCVPRVRALDQPVRGCERAAVARVPPAVQWVEASVRRA